MHRNLKPHNILIQDEETVKISDFTLSRIGTAPHCPYTPEDPKERERSTRETRRLWYRAPELIFRKEIYAFEVDLWSIGCLLSELALGEPLFNGESEVEQLFKIFKFAGAPSEELFNERYKVSDEARIKLPNWPRVYFGYACYDHDSDEFQNLVKTYLSQRDESLYRLMELKDTLGADGLDLLWNLLDLDPSTRITTAEALNHPFFADCHTDMEVDNCGQNDLNNDLQEHIKLLKRNEELLRPDPYYMSKQSMITESMRTILVDWLVDVSMHFEVMCETLHYAIAFIDRTLSLLEIEKNKLQLVGVT